MYDARIRAIVEPEHVGRYLALNVDTGQYVIADGQIEALLEADRIMPTETRYLMRIGYPAIGRFGFRVGPPAK
jgi:hypothetical protein